MRTYQIDPKIAPLRELPLCFTTWATDHSRMSWKKFWASITNMDGARGPSPGNRVGRLLNSYSPELPAKVAAIIEGNFQPSALAQLVSSQLDVDRMDYLLRDSLMTGAKYGIYDLEWIINALAIDEEADRIYVAARGLYAVEEYLQARYYMFRQVYFHRTLRSAEAVLRSTSAASSGTVGQRRISLVCG